MSLLDKFNSFSYVFYIGLFVLPGFLIKSILSAAAPAKKERDMSYFLSCLFYSLINCAAWSWMYYAVYHWATTPGRQHPVLFWIFSILITLAGSLVIGLLIILAKNLKQSKWAVKWLDKLDLNTVHPFQTAWEFIFSKRKTNWVEITLKDGSKIFGLYACNSFTSDSDERDIFIEKRYDVDDKGEWVEDAGSDGVYISTGQIKTIEFLKYE